MDFLIYGVSIEISGILGGVKCTEPPPFWMPFFGKNVHKIAPPPQRLPPALWMIVWLRIDKNNYYIIS